MRSSELSYISVVILGGLGLLCLVSPGSLFPGAGETPELRLAAQLLAAGWLGLAALNWINRGAILGGIYGRAVVVGNFTTYLISTLVLTRPALEATTPVGLRLLPLLLAPVAILYAMRLLRGPSERDLEGQGGG